MLYLLLMLPLGILYFTIAVTGLTLGLRLALSPVLVLAADFGWLPHELFTNIIEIGSVGYGPRSLVAALLCMALGIVILALILHAARAIARGHARLAKALLVEPGA